MSDINTVKLNPDACVACTICLVHCPVAQATPNFLGPRMVGPAYERFRLLGLGEEQSLHYCSNCKNCDIACPHDVPISAFNMRARAVQCQRDKPAFRDWILGHGELLAKWLHYVPAWCKNVGMLNPLTRQLLQLLGISPKAPLPSFAPKSFRTLMQHKARKVKNSSRKVVFFPGCFIDIYDPQTGLDMVWLLEKAGYTVIVPDTFVCCGLPMVANGFWDDAHKNALRNGHIMQDYASKDIPIITGCPSCALMFNADIPEYFPDIATKLAVQSLPKVQDAQDFLGQCVAEGTLSLSPVDACPATEQHTAQGTVLAGSPMQVMYHAPCHLRAQGTGLAGFELMNMLPQVQVTNANAGCCGISGSYGFKKEKYPIGMQVGAELFAVLQNSKAQYAASECGTCRVQIEHGTGMKAVHPVSIVRKILEG